MSKNEVWSETEIKRLTLSELIELYGELKKKEARYEEIFEAAIRNVVVSGISKGHQDILNQLSFIESVMKEKTK